MKNTRLHTLPEEKPYVTFIKRFLGAETEIAEAGEEWLSSGIQLRMAHVLSSSIADEPDEKTYLNFYPVEDGASFLQLSFFPEYDLKANEETYPVIQLIFHPGFFEQWPRDILVRKQPFQLDRSTEQAFTLPASGREAMNTLIRENEANDFTVALQRQEIAIALLRQVLEAFFNPDESNKLPACSFLNNTSERKKVLEAHAIIMSRLDDPITIRELSRMVGINECYLKKGFKAMFGKTIHELTQLERIEAAKRLLKEGQYSINEVAFKMGFGSPSHFSTSFKKIAGMKPCELLG